MQWSSCWSSGTWGWMYYTQLQQKKKRWPRYIEACHCLNGSRICSSPVPVPPPPLGVTAQFPGNGAVAVALWKGTSVFLKPFNASEKLTIEWGDSLCTQFRHHLSNYKVMPRRLINCVLIILTATNMAVLGRRKGGWRHIHGVFEEGPLPHPKQEHNHGKRWRCSRFFPIMIKTHVDLI